MKIAVIGPQNTGKTTFINDFINNFSEYNTPKETYRDIIKQNNLSINQKTSKESQKIIRDFIFHQIYNNTKRSVIFDRSVVCNYVYSLASKGKEGVDGEFLSETKDIMYKSLDCLDYLFFIPTALSVGIVNDKLRDTDMSFIDKINHIFIEVMLEISAKNVVKIITISGNREDRIRQVKEAIKLSY